MSKKLILLFVFFAFFLTSKAQDWQLFNHVDKYNFLTLKDSMINTVWVDTVVFDGSDTLLFFNKVLHYKKIWSTVFNDSIKEAILTYNELFNQVCTVTGDSLFYLGFEKEWLLKPKKGLYETWKFSDDIDALITEYKQDTFLNITDSTKTIELSDGQIIKISKSFGIVYWKMSSNSEIQLLGVEDKFGISVPSFSNYFDYNVGDVFQYYHSEYVESEHASFDHFIK
jgi:hypothetical protein